METRGKGRIPVTVRFELLNLSHTIGVLPSLFQEKASWKVTTLGPPIVDNKGGHICILSVVAFANWLLFNPRQWQWAYCC